MNIKKGRKKGTSLAEVLIILAIISTTVIASTTLVVQSLATIRNNETEDTANGLMVKALEIAKSPAQVYVTDTSFVNAVTGQPYFFSIQNQNDQYLLRRESSDISTCQVNSPYAVDLYPDGSEVSFLACLVVGITRLQSLNQTIYEINSKVIYNLEGETRITNVTGYRKDEFTLR